MKLTRPILEIYCALYKGLVEPPPPEPSQETRHPHGELANAKSSLVNWELEGYRKLKLK